MQYIMGVSSHMMLIMVKSSSDQLAMYYPVKTLVAGFYMEQYSVQQIGN